MATQLAETYYLKALDDYPWVLSEVLENLQYALSYDNTHSGANCLMARLYIEHLKDYAEAEYHLQVALATDPNFICAYELMLSLYISQNRLKKAERLIKYMQKLPTVSQSVLSAGIACILEKRGYLKMAKQNMKMAMAYAVGEDEYNQLTNELDRIKRKIKWQKSAKCVL